MTSLAVSVESDRLLVDLQVPMAELRTMLHAVWPQAGGAP
jgi:hypothetical protein